MRLRYGFTRFFSIFLMIAVLLSFTSLDSFAEDQTNQTDAESSVSDHLDTTIATLQATSVYNPKYTNQKIVIESYHTNEMNTQVEIKPCDIIFIMDQSKWMNTDEDKGASRSAIINQVRELITSLAQPTTGGEHRIAIAGYGRINLGANADAYNSDIYPGLKASGSNISLNTGYYTTGGFVSQNGWSDVSQSNMNGPALPQMPASYQESITYDNAFMSIEEAENVLNEDTMLAWYAGASRMDAGLTIAEQLASVAKEYASSQNENRSLMVCILSSSLPIQNTSYYNLYTIRTAAVLAAADQLKELGATVFAFGDYRASGKTITGDVQDTEENFNYYMKQLCSDPGYFFSFSDFTNVTEALNALIRKITITAAGSAELPHTIKVQEIIAVESDDQHTFLWDDVLKRYENNADYLLNNTMIHIGYHKFVAYDSYGDPIFEEEPYVSTELPLSTIANMDSSYLTYETSLVPIPALEEKTDSGEVACHGEKIVITIAAPVHITYEWAKDEPSYAPYDAALPDMETVVIGETHEPASIEKPDDKYLDDHYEFAGWYLDPECTISYTGTESLTGDVVLYGKWEQYLVIQYYWNYWETGYAIPDSDDKVVCGDIPNDFTPEVDGYEFGGWYLGFSSADETYTDLYTPKPMTEDLKLYAKWIPKTDTKYTLRYFLQNTDEEGYTEVPEDGKTLAGTTGTYVEVPQNTYENYAFSHITYESGSYNAQADALPIQSDGSLVVCIYYNRDTTPEVIPEETPEVEPEDKPVTDPETKPTTQPEVSSDTASSSPKTGDFSYDFDRYVLLLMACGCIIILYVRDHRKNKQNS